MDIYLFTGIVQNITVLVHLEKLRVARYIGVWHVIQITAIAKESLHVKCSVRRSLQAPLRQVTVWFAVAYHGYAEYTVDTLIMRPTISTFYSFIYLSIYDQCVDYNLEYKILQAKIRVEFKNLVE